MKKGKTELEIVTTTVRLTKENHLKLKKFCINNDITMTDFYNDCIDHLGKKSHSRKTK